MILNTDLTQKAIFIESRLFVCPSKSHFLPLQYGQINSKIYIMGYRVESES